MTRHPRAGAVQKSVRSKLAEDQTHGDPGLLGTRFGKPCLSSRVRIWTTNVLRRELDWPQQLLSKHSTQEGIQRLSVSTGASCGGRPTHAHIRIDEWRMMSCSVVVTLAGAAAHIGSNELLAARGVARRMRTPSTTDGRPQLQLQCSCGRKWTWTGQSSWTRRSTSSGTLCLRDCLTHPKGRIRHTEFGGC